MDGLQDLDDQPESSSTLSPEPGVMEYSGNASASNSVTRAHQEEEEDHAQSEPVRAESFGFCVSEATCSCISLLTTSWFLVSVTLMFGLYGSSTLRLGSNCSLRIRANPLFVEYVKVKQLDGTKQGPMLYGFSKDPPLNVLVTSSASERMHLPERSQKDWIYFLNEGSQMNISMTVTSSSSFPLELAIREELQSSLKPGNLLGIEGLTQWLDNPMYPYNIFSSDSIHGNGTIHHTVTKSSNYYVSVVNLNSEIVELNLTLQTLLHNTTQAYYKCSLAYGECTFRTSFPDGNTVVLTTPSTRQGILYDDWYVELSYAPRWITYTVGIGGMAVLIFFAFRLMKCGQHIDDRTEAQYRGTGSERAPLLSNKDDDQSSCTSSDFVSQDDEQVLEMLDGQLKDGGTDINISRMCAICFDAPKDCFFLPCGHCVTCLACGMRIKETSEICPICRRKMKKVRKLFIV